MKKREIDALPLTAEYFGLLLEDLQEAFKKKHGLKEIPKSMQFYGYGNYNPENFNNFSAMHSGNFSHYTKTSFGIPSIGIPLVFSHTYNSYLSDIPNKLTPLQPLGKLWSHSFNSYLQEIDGDTERPQDFRVVFTLPNGGFQTYKKQGSTYVPETEGIYDELVKTNGSTFTLTTKGQVVYTFEKRTDENNKFVFTDKIPNFYLNKNDFVIETISNHKADDKHKFNFSIKLYTKKQL